MEKPDDVDGHKIKAGLPDMSPMKETDKVKKLISKLRWIGMEQEAEAIRKGLSRRNVLVSRRDVFVRRPSGECRFRPD